jgi:hypothetical protein
MKEALNSSIETMPKTLDWDASPPVRPGDDGMYPRAVPGKTQVV